MIGIVLAMTEETSNFYLKLKKFKSVKIKNYEFFYFENKENKCVLVFSGIGKANAASATTALILNFNISLIINIGLCGSLTREIGDIILCKNCRYIDVDVTGFGYEQNQVPKEKAFFVCDNNINSKISSCVPESIYGNCFTSDSFINKNNYKNFSSLFLYNNIDAIDMESASIAQVCDKTSTNFVSIKVVSDNIFLKDKNEKQFEENIIVLNKKISDILELITANL